MLLKRAKRSYTTGCSPQGTMNISFDDLVDLLGPPHYILKKSDPHIRTRCQWEIMLDEEPAIIYDWCQYDTPLSDVKKWSIAGKSVKCIQKFMELKSTPLGKYKLLVDLSKFK